MPTTPQVKFNFINENVQASVPLLGVSHVVACTEKGPYNDPSTLIYNWSQFERLYGKERILDADGEPLENVPQNIKRALELGSIVRVSRVDDSDNSYNKDNWITAVKATLTYTEAYQLILSNLDGVISASSSNSTDICTPYFSVISSVMELIEKDPNIVLYGEITNRMLGTIDPDVSVSTRLSSITALSTLKSKYLSLYFGGLEYYNPDTGEAETQSMLGTVIGLGDNSASKYGPWYSFAGMTRGIIPKTLGPSLGFKDYLGAYDTELEYLQDLSDLSINTAVVKDTRTMGKQTMLWHNFTRHDVQDSERFLGIVRLNLYLKKNLTPILESYLEEPNIWDTWKKIYFEVKEILDDLVTKRAMSEYTWHGDQFATSYAELAVNNEADVRQGKYRAKLVYKDIVALQDITMDIIIDAASGSVSVSSNE